MVGQAHLARTGRGVTVGAPLRQVEVGQRAARELREAHATIARHAAARDTGRGHLLCAHPRNLGERVLDAELLGRARDVDRHVVPHLLPLELVHQVVADELSGLVQRKPERRVGELLLDLREAGGGVHHDGQLTTLRSLHQRLLQLATLRRGRGLEAAAVEDHATALRLETLGVHHLVVRLLEDAHHSVGDASDGFLALHRTHHARHARGEVDNLAGQTSLGGHGFGGLVGLRELGRAGGHVGVPDWNKVAGRRVERGRHRLEHAAAEDTVEGAHHVQERGNHAADGAKVLGEEVGARVCGPLVLELALADLQHLHARPCRQVFLVCLEHVARAVHSAHPNNSCACCACPGTRADDAARLHARRSLS